LCTELFYATLFPCILADLLYMYMQSEIVQSQQFTHKLAAHADEIGNSLKYAI